MVQQINDFGALITPLVRDIAVLDTADIPFSEEVVKACERNACGCYGKTWQCPPGVGTLEERIAVCRSYQTAIVFTTCHPLEDSFDIDGMHQGKIEHEKTTDRILEMLNAPLRERFLAFSAEGCHLCETCTYPDAPCRFPQKSRVSVEANGIFVVELARQCGIRYHNGSNTVTYFSMLLFGQK